MTLPELASLVDMFYIGGTKNGALLGEAIVSSMRRRCRITSGYHLKQRGALLAKGRLLGAQFVALFDGRPVLRTGATCQRHGRAARRWIARGGRIVPHRARDQPGVPDPQRRRRSPRCGRITLSMSGRGRPAPLRDPAGDVMGDAGRGGGRLPRGFRQDVCLTAQRTAWRPPDPLSSARLRSAQLSSARPSSARLSSACNKNIISWRIRRTPRPPVVESAMNFLFRSTALAVATVLLVAACGPPEWHAQRERLHCGCAGG